MSLPANQISNSQDRSASRAAATRIQVNVVALGVTLTLCLVIGISAYFVHGIQLRRIAGAFLDQAQRREEQSQWREAADYLFRYLRLRPEDGSANIRLAETYDRTATSHSGKVRSVELHYRALGLAEKTEDRNKLQRRLIELLLELQRFAEAETECEKLLAGPAGESDPDAHRQLARARYGQHLLGEFQARPGDDISIGATMERAVALNPQAVDLSVTWTLVLRDKPLLLSDEQQKRWPRQQDRDGQANRVIDQLVEQSASSGQAYVARYLYRIEYQLPSAEDDLMRALSLQPDDCDTLVIAANHHRRKAVRSLQQKDSQENVKTYYDEARRYFERAIAIDPQRESVYVGLSDVLLAEGEAEAAIEKLQRGRQAISEPSPFLLLQLAELLIRQDRASEARALLDTYAQSKTNQRLASNAMLTLDSTKLLLEAQLLVGEGEFPQAIALLRPVTNEATLESRVLAIAWSQLGACYAALKSWDQAATAYEAACALETNKADPRRAAAAAWMKANQPKQAIKNLKLALVLVNSKEVKFELARAVLSNQLTTSGQRDWQPLAQLLTELRRAAPESSLSNPWRLPLLQADYTLARARDRAIEKAGIERALKLLRAAELKYPDEQKFWEQVTLRYESLGSTADADRALARFGSLCDPDTADAYLLASRVSAQRGQIADARQLLQKGLGSVPVPQQRALDIELARLDSVGSDSRQESDRLVTLLQDASDLPRLTDVGMLYLSERNFSGAERIEEILREKEGPEGTLWRYLRATRLLGKTQSVSNASFAEVIELQGDLQNNRPNWSRSFSLKGRIEDRLGNRDQALEAYSTAIALGERRTFVYERIVRLLYQAGRVGEAESYLSKLERDTPLSQELSNVAIALSARQKDHVKAESLARQGVVARPKDPLAWIWYGQTLAMNKQHDSAEKAVRKAVEVAPKDLRSWTALFGYLLRTGERESARKVLSQMSAAIEVPDAQRAFVLAQRYEMLQDVEQAARKYDEATTLAPEDVAFESSRANFLLRNNLPAAKNSLRRLLQITAERDDARQTRSQARRALARLLAQSGDEFLPEAIGLLQAAGDNGEIDQLDKQLHAALLMQQKQPDLKQAQQLLEPLVLDSRAPTDQDRLLLASVYSRQADSVAGQERETKLLKAQQQFRYLCERENPQATHLVAFINLLIGQASWQEANRWLDRLGEVEPANRERVALRTRWAREQVDDTTQQKQLVEQLGERLVRNAAEDAVKAQACLTIGEIYSQLEMPTEAKSWFGRAVDLEPKLIANVSQSLVDKHEAITFCKRIAQQTDQPYAATELASLLTSAGGSDAESAGADAILGQALQKHPNDASLSTSIGNLRVQQKRTAEAIGLYRISVKNDPDNVIALNNLATLLSEDADQLAEALGYANQAIKLIGPAPPLLDTKGVILLQLGQTAEALDMLKTAAATGNDPRFQFHLALAWKQAGELDQARGALKTANENNLTGQLLTEDDLQVLAELKAALN